MGTHRRLPNSYVSDWTNGLGDNWANVTSSSGVREDIDGKPHLKLGGTGAGDAYRLMPRFVLTADTPFEVVVNFKASIPTTGWHGIVLYGGESNYLGVYFDPSIKPEILDLSPDRPLGDINKPIARTDWTYTTGDNVRVKFVRDPLAQTVKIYVAKNSEEFPQDADWTRTSISQGGNHTDIVPVPSLWISGVETDTPFYYGDITIERTAATEVLAGAFDYYPWSTKWNNTWDCMDWTPYLSYYDPYNPTVNIPFIQDAPEGAPSFGGLTFMPYDHPSGDTLFRGGSYTILSGAITGELGTLKLYGSQGPAGQGHFRVRVLGSDGQTPVSDTLIPGNSTGFFPNAGPYAVGAEVGLSNVPAGTIYLEYHAEFTGNGAWWTGAEWEPAPTLHGFTVDGTLPPFMPPAGSYPNSVTVTLTDPQGGQIIYTTNGVDPRWHIPVVDGKAVFDESGAVVLLDEPIDPNI